MEYSVGLRLRFFVERGGKANEEADVRVEAVIGSWRGGSCAYHVQSWTSLGLGTRRRWRKYGVEDIDTMIQCIGLDKSV